MDKKRSPQMSRLQRRLIDLGLLVLRLGMAGLMLGVHGHAKLVRAFDYVARGEPWPFVTIVHELGMPLAPLFALASAGAESLGSALVAVGLWTRLAGAGLAANMLVAICNEWMGGDPIERPALYLVAAITIVLTGAGRYSLDVVRARKRGARERVAAFEVPASAAARAAGIR